MLGLNPTFKELQVEVRSPLAIGKSNKRPGVAGSMRPAYNHRELKEADLNWSNQS